MGPCTPRILNSVPGTGHKLGPFLKCPNCGTGAGKQRLGLYHLPNDSEVLMAAFCGHDVLDLTNDGGVRLRLSQRPEELPKVAITVSKGASRKIASVESYQCSSLQPEGQARRATQRIGTLRKTFTGGYPSIQPSL